MGIALQSPRVETQSVSVDLIFSIIRVLRGMKKQKLPKTLRRGRIPQKPMPKTTKHKTPPVRLKGQLHAADAEIMKRLMEERGLSESELITQLLRDAGGDPDARIIAALMRVREVHPELFAPVAATKTKKK